VIPSVPDGPLLAFAFLGMALLGIGVFWRDRRNHWARIAGWLVFGLFWPFKVPHYALEAADPFNAWFSLLAPILTGYIAYHEWLSWQWREQPVALRWLAGSTFVAATTYFVLFEITAIQEQIIYVTGVETSWLTDLVFGTETIAYQPAQPGPDGYRPTHICMAEGYGNQIASFCQRADAGYPYYAVTIIFACTALQSVMIFVGAIGFTKAPWKRKLQAIGVIAPTIYLLNLFRNAGIIYGYRVKSYSLFGIESFEFMHSYVAKGGAIVALVVLALYAFRKLPELHENILDVLDLPKRTKAQAPKPTPPTADS